MRLYAASGVVGVARQSGRVEHARGLAQQLELGRAIAEHACEREAGLRPRRLVAGAIRHPAQRRERAQIVGLRSSARRRRPRRPRAAGPRARAPPRDRAPTTRARRRRRRARVRISRISARASSGSTRRERIGRPRPAARSPVSATTSSALASSGAASRAAATRWFASLEIAGRGGHRGGAQQQRGRGLGHLRPRRRAPRRPARAAAARRAARRPAPRRAAHRGASARARSRPRTIARRGRSPRARARTSSRCPRRARRRVADPRSRPASAAVASTRITVSPRAAARSASASAALVAATDGSSRASSARYYVGGLVELARALELRAVAASCVVGTRIGLGDRAPRARPRRCDRRTWRGSARAPSSAVRSSGMPDEPLVVDLRGLRGVVEPDLEHPRGLAQRAARGRTVGQRTRLGAPLGDQLGPALLRAQQIDQRLARERVVGPQREHLAIQLGRELDRTGALAQPRGGEQRGAAARRHRSLRLASSAEQLGALLVAAELRERRLEPPLAARARRGRAATSSRSSCEHRFEIAVAAREPDRALEDRALGVARRRRRRGRAQARERRRRPARSRRRARSAPRARPGSSAPPRAPCRARPRASSNASGVADLVREQLRAPGRRAPPRRSDRARLLARPEPGAEQRRVRRREVRLRELGRIAARRARRAPRPT